jgi:hypothetical protein
MRVLFTGQRVNGRCLVQMSRADSPPTTVPLHLEVRSHSPTGFDWGYSGSGPAQLALALLCEVLHDTERALAIYQLFKSNRITLFNRDHWSLSDVEIQQAARECEIEVERMEALERLNIHRSQSLPHPHL